jgi:hypothetical protein
MQAKAISNGYTSGKVYIIWEIPHDKISGYEIDRNGITIASSFLEEPSEFIQPTMFDHDHHTNLFRKDSTKQLMFIDENVQPYQEYEYQVIAKRINENGDTLGQIESDFMYVTAQ